MKEGNMTATPLKTSITMIVDRSGSMGSHRDAAISSVNKYLAEARTDSVLKDADFELMIFDSQSIDTIRTGRMADVKDITHADFEPRDMTPLYDAIGRGVDGLDRRAVDGKAVLVIVTDGLENHSRKHTFDSIRELIHARQEKGWLIVFLGAGLAAAQQGTAMGIQAGSVANIGMDEQSLHNTMASVRCMMDDYAATPDLAEAKAYAAGAAFSIKARTAMGDPSGGAGLVKSKGGKKLDPSTNARKQGSSLPNSPDDTWASSSGDAWGT
jgi:hypothetical protein